LPGRCHAGARRLATASAISAQRIAQGFTIQQFVVEAIREKLARMATSR
jgi:hypothetical protein